MTLRNSSVKALATEDLKQNKYFIIIHTIILLLITTLPALMTINNYNQLSIKVNLLRDIYETLTAGTSFTFVAVCIIGTIIGTINFSYLFSTKSVIFYHSMPHKRETIFISKILSGICAIIIPLAVVFIINMIIYFLTGFFAPVSFKYFIASYLIILLMYIFTFSVSTLAASFASNVFAQYIVIGFIYLVYPFTSLVMMGFVEGITDTFSFVPHLFTKPEYLFPPAQLMSNINFDFGQIFLTRYSIDITHCVYTLIVSTIAFAAAIILYKKRKTENTNKFICFNFVKTFLKYYITSVAALGAMIVFYMMSEESMIGGLIGLVIGAFIVFSVLEAIFEKSVKSMFKNIKGYISITLSLCVAVVAFSSIMINLDNRFPDNVKMIEFKNLSGDIHDVNNLVLKDENNIKYAVNFLKNAAQKPESEMQYHHYVNVTTDAYDFWGFNRHFSNISDEEMSAFISKIYDSREYKNCVTDFGNGDLGYLSFVGEKAKYANRFVHYDGWGKTENNDDARGFKVLDALKKDIEKYSYSDVKNSDTEFEMSFAVDGKSSYVSVKECYAETLKALKDYGFILEDNNSIAKMAFLNYETLGADYEDNFAVEDEEILKIMLDYPIQSRLWKEKRISARYYYADGTLTFTGEYKFDDLPEKVKKYIVDNDIPLQESEKTVSSKTGVIVEKVENE